MSNTQIVVLNCPPRSGKDTIAAELVNKDGYNMLSFKSHLITIALVVSNVSLEEWNERYETMKDVPWDRLGGLSQRQYLIKISEEWVKPVHGKNYFGNIVAENSEIQKKYVLPDGGFEEEIVPLYETYGERLLIIQWRREGCSFENDSRNWITGYPEITRRVRDNNSTIEDQYIAVKNTIKEYYEI